ncbi:relaxase/mobilization nuclease domain-containing protein [Steroidobacter flavus]|uniref:Relaxase/mobilization nuclease domain-containing protein n=1 Tax=Steroidobacter flavus TaxID=1842136 RepID=A0ABV8T763_9GAMM
MKPLRLRGRPLFDLESHGRAGPAERLHLTAAQIDQIGRTVRRVPEVMIKVSSGKGSSTSRGVNAHFHYISRAGEREIETDDGERLLGRESVQRLVDDWDLDLDEDRQRRGLFVFYRRKPPKLVRRIIFSMPAGTPPEKLLAAVRDFARDKFYLKHRYAMALHTDKPHPHVHVTLKAVSESGSRIDIRRATLRDWRQEFARHLRAHGVEANATDRRIRGQSRAPKLDSIFRAARRGESSHVTSRISDIVHDLNAGSLDEPRAARLQRTRTEVVRGWQVVRHLLITEGRHQLAGQVSKFVSQMSPPRTDKQWLLSDVLNASTEPISRTTDRDSSVERSR